jgi:hypothetical protein
MEHYFLLALCFMCFNNNFNVSKEVFMMDHFFYLNICNRVLYIDQRLLSGDKENASSSSSSSSSLSIYAMHIPRNSSKNYTQAQVLGKIYMCMEENVEEFNLNRTLEKLVRFFGRSNLTSMNENLNLQQIDEQLFSSNELQESNSKSKNREPNIFRTIEANHKYAKGKQITFRTNGAGSHEKFQFSQQDGNFATFMNDKLSNSPYKQITTILLILVYSFAIVLSVFGNFLVIMVMCCSSSYLDISFYLINLSVFSLLMSIFCIPFTFVNALLGRWIFNSFMCPFTNFIQLLSVNGCILTLTLLAINRFYAVAYPLKYNTERTRNHIHKSLFIIWMSSIGLSAIQLFIYKSSKVEFENKKPNNINNYNNFVNYDVVDIQARNDINNDNNSNLAIRRLNESSFSSTSSSSSSLSSSLLGLISSRITNQTEIATTSYYVTNWYCVCREVWVESDESASAKYYLAYTIWIFLQTYLIPVFILIIMYSKIIYILWNRNCNKLSYLQGGTLTSSEGDIFKTKTIKVKLLLFLFIMKLLKNYHLFLYVFFSFSFFRSFEC